MAEPDDATLKREAPGQGELAATFVAESAPRAQLARGSAIARFLVLDRLGEGGMAVVYSAYDPKLDRRIAIKLLKADEVTTSDRDLLLNEAQATARLSHPNVVPVFDAGTFGSQLFIAMELESGRSLQGWLAERPRPWSEVLRPFLEAGAGLAAAHAAGIVHRDFKPANVLLSSDGRALVSDFGLAHRTGQASSELAGTPAYMAPEQFTGGEVGPLADQYSFCASLWEALTRRLPFAGGDFASQRKATLEGDLSLAPREGIPRWLLPHLVRGLARRAEDRFPAMPDLLRVLRQNPWARARRLAGWAALALFLAGLGSVIAWQRWRESHRCEREAEQSAASVWNPSVRGSLERQWGLPHEMAQRFLDDIGGRVHRWTGLQAQICQRAADGERGTAPIEQCLVRQRDLLAPEQLATLRDPRLIATAIEDPGDAAAACLEVATTPAPESPELVALRRDLDQISTLFLLERSDEAIALARKCIASADALGALRERSRAEHLLADALSSLDTAPTEAERLMRQAILDSDEAADDYDSALDRVALVRLLSAAGRLDEAASALPAAEAWVRRLGSPLQRQISLEEIREDLFGRQGRHAEALQAAERLSGLSARYWGPRSMHMGEAHIIVGAELAALGRFAKAAEQHRAALDIMAAAPWTSPTNLAIAWGNLAEAELQLGHFDKGLEAADRGEQALAGNPSGDLFNTLPWLRVQRADLLATAGRIEEAASLVASIDFESKDLGASTQSQLYLVRSRQLLAKSDPRSAAKAAERAVALAGSSVYPRARARFVLAQALAADSKQLGEATGIARQALAELPSDGDAALRGEIQRWLEGRATSRAR